MLAGNLVKRSLERALTNQPFIGDHSQRILIAGRARMPLNLLRSHISCRACYRLRALLARRLYKRRNPKITQQHLATAADQHILWLHIAVNQPLVMRVLQRLGNLLEIGRNRGRRERHPPRQRLAQ